MTIPFASATRRGRVLIGAGILTGAIFITALYGFIPGLIRALPSFFITIGRIECGSLSLTDLLRLTCPVVGGEAGGVFQSNLPITVFSVALNRMGFPADWAMFVIAFLLILAGLWGCYWLFRSVGANEGFALIGSLAFLASTSMLGILNFSGMIFGLLAMSFGLAVEHLALEAIIARRWRRAIIGGALFGISSLLTVFSDGYSFIFFATASASIGIVWLIRHRKLSASWVTAGIYVAVLAVTYASFSLVPRSGSWGKSPIELFRAMGLDPATLFIPSTGLWWSSPLGLSVDSSILWGDGTNSAHNYLGFGMIALAIVGLIANRRHHGVLIVALVIVAVLALVLALGPSLKWYSIRGELPTPVPYGSYLMPSDEALFDLPTAWLYANVPGFEYMRATYRWAIVSRFVVVALATLGATLLWRRARWLGVLVFVIAVAEVTVNVPTTIAQNSARSEQARTFDRDVTDPMNAAIESDARVIFWPNAIGGNDFLANYLAPRIDVWTYNVGNDKALERARIEWPSTVTEFLESDDDGFEPESVRDSADELLTSGTVDLIVVPYFDLRWSSYGWPSSARYAERGLEAALIFEDDDRFVTEEFDHFAIVRSAQ
jgi:hypothetical protein